MSELPRGWTTIRIGDVGVWRGGGTPSKANSSFWTGGTIPWVSPKDMKRSHIAEAIDNITEEAIKGSATQLVPEGSVLIVTRSGILQHSLPVAANTVPVAINQDLKALTPKEGIETEFLMRQLQADAQEILKTCTKSGTTVESIDFERLKDHEFRLPPLPEQRRIVAKVDGLIARTARARKELDCIPNLIAHYKQRLLATAFSGVLTAAWRIHRGFEEPALKTVDELAEGLRYGTAQKCYEEPKGIAVLRIPNVLAGKVSFNDLKYAQLSASEFEKLKLYVGDLLVVRSNGSADLVGRPALVEEQAAGMAYAGYLIRIRPRTDLIVPKFLAFMLEAPVTRSTLQENARSTNGIHNVNAKELGRLPIPFFAMEEQAEIVRRIESAFVRLDRVAADHAAAERLILKLDAAILAKAHCGQLVPQDPNDEPASVLIERMRAENNAAPAKAPSRKATAATEKREAPRRRGQLGKGTTMRKSRKDADVKGQPYLTQLVREMGGKVRPNELYTASNLDMVDFYQQLSIEHDCGWLENDNMMVKAA